MTHKKSTGSSGSKKSATPKDKYKVTAKNTKKGTDKRSSALKTAEAIREKRRNSLSAQLTPFLLIVLAILLAVFIYLRDFSGAVGGAIGAFFAGIFAGGSIVIPPIIILIAIRWKRDAEEGQNSLRVMCGIGVIFLLSVFLHIVLGGTLSFSPITLYTEGLDFTGGGLIGGFFGTLLWQCFRIAAPIMAVAGLIVLAPMMFGLTPKGFFEIVSIKLKAANQRRREIADEKSIIKEDRIKREKMRRERLEREAGVSGFGKASDSEQLTLADESASKKKRNKENFEADVPMPDGDKYEDIAPEIDESIFDAALRDRADLIEQFSDGKLSEKIDSYAEDTKPVHRENSAEKSAKTVSIPEETPAVTDYEPIDLKDIFSDPADAELFDKLCAAYMPEGDEAETELTVKRDTVSSVTPAEDTTAEKKPVRPEPPVYKFPPIDLLSPDNSKKDPGIREELRENALKLVETLKSFNVKTKIVDVSRGPTITRYELMPESGTKVRTISNLTDDIALSFAATGVRIEAPIPGKSAVGIEVPNKTSSTVHLRTLLEDERFAESKSNICAALGEDVAGEAIYLDIAKMPHLLIAGATGMGKSVCINSLIVSLLYKASPTDVKLILIDPKKVELSIYNGLPHLLVPVVSDPKKAAGSLSWAVSEMERRFNLIEEVGVRDLKNYNDAVKGDPEREILPQIVIIIDELADLMMTAPDDVEGSICRLAQKARAAGMHLIIGTQRPSVDVITGLLKSNIPSRIAFTVASQVDSRTIIDRAGAERLIGRGDMLYNPVGAAKPIRVQGAFVSESEVEAVVGFIKSQIKDRNEGYNEDVIEQIEREAEKCGAGKKKSAIDPSAADDGDEDPMLRAALELAVESRKISTSLIQRRLSLGYGRAAKLIDRMEQMGYVSAPDGQKPREVLISKEEFMEMALRDEE